MVSTRPPAPTTAPPAEVGITGAARRLDRSEATIRRLADNGTLPHRRDHDGNRIFRLADLDEYVRTRPGRKVWGVPAKTG